MLSGLKRINIISLSLVLILSSCTDSADLPQSPETPVPVSSPSSSEPQPNPSSGTEPSSETEIKPVSAMISSSGGRLSISDPDSPVNNLSIEVPASSYQNSRNFEVSYSEIATNPLNNKNIRIISPMIVIKNGGGYSQKIMKVKVPVTKSAEEFAFAVAYNEKNSSFEVMPLIEETNDSLTFASRHFSYSDFSSENAYSSFFIAVINDSSDLLSNSQITTDFKPGVDDWEFENRGSVINTKGISSGIALSSLWYFYEKKLNGSVPLNSLFDSQSELWQDNRKGYRLAAISQKLYEDSGLSYQNLSGLNSKLQWNLFIASMLITGKPQLLGLSRKDSSQVLIAYKLDISKGRIYVADPNFEKNSGEERFIHYENGLLSSYLSPEKFGTDSKSYNMITYNSSSSYYDWHKLGEKWQEIENETFGNEFFPKVEYRVYTDSTDTSAYKILSDDFVSPKREIMIQAYSGSGATSVKVYELGSELSATGNGNYSKFDLHEGYNLLGVWSYFGTKENPDWIDFRYFNVKYQDLLIKPASMQGVVDKEYFWQPESSLSSDTIYEWNFGDGSKKSSLGNNYVYHKYTLPGNYTIDIKAKDPSNNSIIAEASTKAKITKSNDSLNSESLSKLSVSFNAVNTSLPFIYNQDGSESAIKSFQASNNNSSATVPLVWSGNSFSVSFDENSSQGIKTSYKMSGILDFYNKKLIELNLTTTIVQNGVSQSESGFTARNVPLLNSSDSWKFDYNGLDRDLSNYLSTSAINLSGNHPSSINWQNAHLKVIFQ